MTISKQSTTHLMLFVIMIVAGFSFPTHATSINELNKSDRVVIKTWLSEPANKDTSLKTPRYAVNEQIILYIEVATPRWFTSGTRIANIEIPNVVTKQRNTLATNFTERKDGITWSHQRWEITLYPQEKGRFVVPSTEVNIEVSREGGGNVSGTLYSAPQQFTAAIPSGLLTDDQTWVSGRNLSIDQQWNRSSEELKVGDTITRILTIRGEDTLAMLLPNIINSSSSNEYQSYPQPNQLSDSQTRGDYFSERKESSVYVLQAGGDLTFPSYQLTWWDLDAQQLKTIEVAGETVKVSHTLQSWLKTYWNLVLGVAAGVILFGFVAIRIRHYYKTHPLPGWWIYSRAVKHSQWSQVRVLLYRVLRQQHQQLELKKHSQVNEWQQDSTDFQSEKVTVSLSRAVWKKVNVLSSPLIVLFTRLTPKRALPQLDKYREHYLAKNTDVQEKSHKTKE
ncbi:BatD family protein [Aliivibrio finisterrensis]|uniref:Protein BatD n=1 Tax=Aliivibrio finisterrensis TaxID=511998 RepID=A0A6N6RT44_9GAMM|nr:BatD family protein [Aliivibrio finisterrensis]KAB2824806.1 protein BatD [Aliivibrio finisterrensis]